MPLVYLIIDILVPLFLLLLGVFMLRRALVLYRLSKIPACPKCRYDLTGSSSTTCPECGAPCPQKTKPRLPLRWFIPGLVLTFVGLMPLPAMAIQAWLNHQAGKKQQAFKASLPADMFVFVDPATASSPSPLVGSVAQATGMGKHAQRLMRGGLFSPQVTLLHSSPGYYACYLTSMFANPFHHFGRYFPYEACYFVASDRRVKNRTSVAPLLPLFTTIASNPKVNNLQFDRHHKIIDTDLAPFWAAPHIQYMSFEHIDLTLPGIPAPHPKTKLDKVGLHFNGAITDNHVKSVLTLPNMRAAWISGNASSRLTPACLVGALPTVATQTSHKMLYLNAPFYCENNPDPFINIPSDLERMGLVLPDVTPAQLATLERAVPERKISLDFTGNPHLDDDSLRFLARRIKTNYTLVLAAGKNMTAQSILHLVDDVNKLHPRGSRYGELFFKLSLTSFPIDAKTLTTLAPHISYNFTLRNTRLDDQAVAALSQMKLSTLTLDNVQIPQNAWSKISQIQGLTHLKLNTLDDAILTQLSAKPSLVIFPLEDLTTPAAKTAAQNPIEIIDDLDDDQ